MDLKAAAKGTKGSAAEVSEPLAIFEMGLETRHGFSEGIKAHTFEMNQTQIKSFLSELENIQKSIDTAM